MRKAGAAAPALQSGRWLHTERTSLLFVSPYSNSGAAIPSTEERHLLAIATESIYSGSVIETLSAGDIIDMAVSAAIALTLTLSTGVTVTLSVKRLDDALAN